MHTMNMAAQDKYLLIPATTKTQGEFCLTGISF